MTTHPKHEKTLIIIKPDGVQRNLIGEIISRFERAGLKLVAMKMVVADVEMVKKFYTLDPEWMRLVGEKSIKGLLDKGIEPISRDPMVVAQSIIDRLSKYLTSGPVIPMVWQGGHAVSVVRKIVGSTEPVMSDVGTIRGDYVLDSYQMAMDDERCVRNLVHASGTVDETEGEIKIWFTESEIKEYTLANESVIYGF
ncbi:nucleoside-diphosphate kinase [Candidatus Parcubacteria bacterium]|nr:nucleoside-diphosphate kinase [Candidatus Parcubacteria bacterium]